MKSDFWEIQFAISNNNTIEITWRHHLNYSLICLWLLCSFRILVKFKLTTQTYIVVFHKFTHPAQPNTFTVHLQCSAAVCEGEAESFEFLFHL